MPKVRFFKNHASGCSKRRLGGQPPRENESGGECDGLPTVAHTDLDKRERRLPTPLSSSGCREARGVIERSSREHGDQDS